LGYLATGSKDSARLTTNATTLTINEFGILTFDL
jgi:hypothetical protein